MLKICEIYPAIQGESSRVGLPCFIVRLGECNLDCSWCDTPHARHEFAEMEIGEVLEQCRASGLGLILITGGEPLMQKDALILARRLIDEKFEVLLESNGSLPLDGLPDEVVVILDYKLKGSGMNETMLPENLNRLRSQDELKMVISDREDFLQAARIVRERGLAEKTNVLFSPAFGSVKPEKLAEWILAERLPVRLNLQIHKYIWDPGERRR